MILCKSSALETKVLPVQGHNVFGTIFAKMWTYPGCATPPLGDFDKNYETRDVAVI